MKKLQRRQQQNNANEINEKKPKKKVANDSLLNHYMFDEEGENIGKYYSYKNFSFISFVSIYIYN